MLDYLGIFVGMRTFRRILDVVAPGAVASLMDFHQHETITVACCYMCIYNYIYIYMIIYVVFSIYVVAAIMLAFPKIRIMSQGRIETQEKTRGKGLTNSQAAHSRS